MNILITLDYELYLGSKTGTPENCLVRPMAKLTEVLDVHNAKFVIFVDAAYLLRLNQLKDRYAQINNDYVTVSEHIKMLEHNGNDIQLHFHPQWLYSDWSEVEQCWKMDYQHYKLSDMEPSFAHSSFREAKLLLDSLLEHPTRVFRAGGYCLDDFKDFQSLFNENGIIADSSVSRGNYRHSGSHRFDYRKVPKKTIYKFSKSIKEEDCTGRFTELSISNLRMPYLISLFSVRMLKKKYKASSYHYGDGISIGNSVFKNNEAKKTVVKRLFSTINYTASLDKDSSTLLMKQYTHCKRSNTDLIIVGHPKEATESSVACLESWLENKNEEDKVVTTKDILD